jgi:hypothetical protein
LSQNYQDYLREFYGPSADQQMKSTDFIAYKQHLIRYLEEFIQELQSSAAQIGAMLEAISPPRLEHILALVHQSELEIPVQIPGIPPTGKRSSRYRTRASGNRL